MPNYPFDFATPQSAQQPSPNTQDSAATITPVHKFTRLTGTTAVTKIVPPDEGGYCELTFVWTTGTANGFNTGGSGAGAIAVAYTTITDRPVTLYYDPRTQLWYPQTVV
jgi:hypothetical protein